MKYKDYDIRREEITLSYGGKVSGFSIYKDEKRMSYADTKETAMRYIDSRSSERRGRKKDVQ